jgi:trk system potassium uptake protein TrkH
MIPLQPIFFTIGIFLTCLAGMMVIPGLLDWVNKDYNWSAFAISTLITAFMGLLLTFANRPSDRVVLSVRETFILTAVTWGAVAFFAAIPFVLTNTTGTLTDAFFETISGLTTTGATVMTGLDFTSQGILLWRALLQWFGGIGIIVMAITVLPLLRIGGMQLFRSEFSDRSEKILPRVSQIATAILATYVFLTLLCIGLLYAAGMSLFEAICHAFATLSTGGFSTSDSSIGYFNKPLIEIITMIFMLVGAITLTLFVQSVKGKPKAIWQDSQARAFLSVTLISILLMTVWLIHIDMPFWNALRHSSFHIISMITTTGFVAGDFTAFGLFPILLILLLMMVGGCTGSTAGGVKILRYQILLSVIKSHIYQLRRPHGVFTPTYNKKPIPEGVATSVFTLFGLYMLSFALLSLGLSLYNLDLATSISAAASCLNNVGPGFGALIGPYGTYAPLPDGAKWLLMFGMLLGRLEYITILILFIPSFWRD